jgi:hypothetical protein
MRRAITILAIVLVVVVIVAEHLGVRAYVGALSGTMSAGAGELALGTGYVTAYFVVTICVPIWFLALLLDAVYGRLRAWISPVR